MFIAWLPFLYAELTSEEAEGKDRDLPAVDKDDSHPEAVPVAEQDPEAEQAPAEEPAAAPAEGTEAAKAPTAAQAPGEPGATAEPPAAVAPEGVAQAAAEGEDEGEDEEEGEPEPEPPVASGPVAVLRQAFERQPRDGLWAGDVEHKLRGLFGTADVPAALRDRVPQLGMPHRPEVEPLTRHRLRRRLRGHHAPVGHRAGRRTGGRSRRPRRAARPALRDAPGLHDGRPGSMSSAS